MNVAAKPELEPANCPICNAPEMTFIKAYNCPPEGENRFDIADYHRELWQCTACKHVINCMFFDPAKLYEADYWDSAYSGDKMQETFKRITNLPPEKSDNYHRVERINNYFATLYPDKADTTFLDVGTGLAVFPAGLAAKGWTGFVNDPDTRAVNMAYKNTGCKGFAGDFLKIKPQRTFDLITLNKVVEHVPHTAMVPFLEKAANMLSDCGLIYLELPDGEGALTQSPEREEFFIEHYAAFSFASMAMLAAKAGLFVQKMERIREPSCKYTLYAFLSKTP